MANIIYAGIAQLVEQQFCKLTVAGSTPAVGFGGSSVSDSTSPLQGERKGLNPFFSTSFWGYRLMVRTVDFLSANTGSNPVNPLCQCGRMVRRRASNPTARVRFPALAYFGTVAQLVERCLEKAGVVGSNPARSTFRDAAGQPENSKSSWVRFDSWRPCFIHGAASRAA